MWKSERDSTSPDSSDGTYTLSGLLRGRFGTEQKMANHEIGDQFVLMTTALRRTEDGITELNSERSYKAQSFDGLFDDSTVRTLSNAGNERKPYAVAHLRASRDGSDNITLSWKRRSRFRTGWGVANNSILSDSPESYEVEVYTPDFLTLKRVLAASSESLVYSIADQTTDFGAAQDPVGFRVYQLNADVGRGYPREAVL